MNPVVETSPFVVSGVPVARTGIEPPAKGRIVGLERLDDRLEREASSSSLKKSLPEEFLVDALFFATFLAWGLLSSTTTVAWIPLVAHVFASTVATIVAFTTSSNARPRRRIATAIVAGWSCALVGSLDALVVAQVGCRLWDTNDASSSSRNPTSLSSGVDASREVDVVLVASAHLLGLATSAYRARRAGHELDVNASFVSLGAGFGVACVYALWIVLDASLSRYWLHLFVFVLVLFVLLGPVVDLLVVARADRGEWVHVLHSVGVVGQYVVFLANVAYLFDDETTLWGLTHPYESTCARAQGVGLLFLFACANAHRNTEMLTATITRRRGRSLVGLAEIDPWASFVVWINGATRSVGPTVVAVTVAFAENATGVARFVLLGYAALSWTRGKTQVASCGWVWEIFVALVGGFIVDLAAVLVLLFWPGLVRADEFEDVERRVIAGVAAIDGVVALVVASSAWWAIGRTKEKSC